MANNVSVDSNCKVQWRFESGALTTDSKGGNDLSSSGSPSANTDVYKEGSASLQLDTETDDNLYITDTNLDAGVPFKSGDTNKKMSVCFWVRMDSLPVSESYTRYCLTKDTVGQRSFNIKFTRSSGDTKLRFTVSANGTGWAADLIHGSAIEVGKWYFVCITYQASDGAYRLHIWDDTAQNTLGTDLTGTTIEIFAGTANLQIGYDSAPANMDGQLDEMLIFDDVLTTDEIDQIRAGIYGPQDWVETINDSMGVEDGVHRVPTLPEVVDVAVTLG